MRSLIFFLLVTNVCFSQEPVTVINRTGQRLSDVSVFQLSAENSLLGISDSLGNLKITLVSDQKYLFHLLGYVDQIFTTEDLKRSPTVTLENGVYQLKEVVAQSGKLKRIKIVNKPGNWMFGESNNVKATFERVSPLKIEKSGFLSKFSLYADQNFDGEVRKFTFVMLNAVNGKPDISVINCNVSGRLEGGWMVFHLDTLGLFIENGQYFIGYETQNNGILSDHSKKIKTKTGFRLQYPVVFVKGKTVKHPASFRRNNLKEWGLAEASYKMEDGKPETKYYDFGYQLEMRIPVAN